MFALASVVFERFPCGMLSRSALQPYTFDQMIAGCVDHDGFQEIASDLVQTLACSDILVF